MRMLPKTNLHHIQWDSPDPKVLWLRQLGRTMLLVLPMLFALQLSNTRCASETRIPDYVHRRIIQISQCLKLMLKPEYKNMSELRIAAEVAQAKLW